jgi:hypothetical protein
MANKQMDLIGRLLQQLPAELKDTGSSIQNDDLSVVTANFYARGIAAIAERIATRHGN